MNVEGLNDIPIPLSQVKRIAAALGHARQALRSIPDDEVSADDPLLQNYAQVLAGSRAKLQNVVGVLEHLLERAASCH